MSASTVLGLESLQKGEWDPEDFWKTMAVHKLVSCCWLLCFIPSWKGHSDISQGSFYRKLSPSFANKVGFGFQPAFLNCLWNNPVALAQLNLMGVNCTSLSLLRKINQILGPCLSWQRVFFIRAGAWQHQPWGHQPSCTVSHVSQDAKENNYNLLEMIGREHTDLPPKNSTICLFPCNKHYIYLWKQYVG